MEHKVYYKIEIYKGLFNHDVGFNNMPEPIVLRVEDEIEMRIVVSAAAVSYNTCIVYAEVE